MKTILFPTDFATASLNAFAYALHLVGELDAEILTLHVYDLPVIMPSDPEGGPVAEKIYRTGESSGDCQEGIHKLKAIAEELQLSTINIRHLFAVGDAVHEIRNAIDIEQADFVVMGTKGAGEVAVTLFGSTTEKVIAHSGVPVFAVPSGCRYSPVRNILFLTHYYKMETQKLEELYTIVQPLKAWITVLEVSKDNNASGGKFINRWKKHFHGKPITFHRLSQATIEEILEEFLQEHRVDLLAMQVHHKNFFERLFAYSLSKKLVYYSTVPLLSLPV